MADQKTSVLEQVNVQAATDNEFRAKLLKDPRSAIKEKLGFELPTTFTIKFVEKPENLDAMVVLPDYVPDAEALSEEQLEAVAGGWCLIDSCNGTSCSSTAAVTK